MLFKECNWCDCECYDNHSVPIYVLGSYAYLAAKSVFT